MKCVLLCPLNNIIRDSLIIIFLMSTEQLAAKRFVTYWENRLEVFGPEKFCQPMKLSEALRDDAVALQAGVLTLLPKRDSFGRHLLFAEPRRDTKEGYDADSMVSRLRQHVVLLKRF